MNVFYEEDGGFKVGHVMSDIGTSLQIESVSGKRSKIKANAVVLRFESALDQYLPEAEKIAAQIEPDFLWEVCGTNEFGCEDMAQEYFGHKPSSTEAAAVALKLHAAPMYFYKRGKGRYQAAPEENLKAALASIERKKREAEQMAGWVAQLKAGAMPDEFRPHRDTLLYKPDRNTLMVKACEAAEAETHTSLPLLFFNAGAWPDRDTAQYEYHLGKFLSEYFPRGRQYQGEIDAVEPADLPLADVCAYSIDDAATTEVDDAFSVRHLGDGQVEIGIHIAAPALYFGRDGALEKLANTRLSTVYFPGDKITMLPDTAVAHATLAEGRICPAVSYYTIFSADLQLLSARSAIERVKIEKNLRIDRLEKYFNENAIAAGRADGEYGEELILLHRIAMALGSRRGKDENEIDRVDYNFDIVDGKVSISTRKRGNPIDTVVSELMIFVNSEWGKLLADNGVAAIYRSQQNMKTRMTTDALPHEGLGVAQYAWSSSPLRRYVDLVNQRQLIAFLRGETPPYQRRVRDSISQLSELARRFDLTYDAYNEFQRNLERYWCLRYLAQEGITQYPGTMIRDELVRADALPLIVKLDRNPELPPKTPVTVNVGELDYWDISGRFTLAENAVETPQAA
ncbi:MAG: RNB domain-containing ribonuclease [Betaproteobacteria bacterium]|nr:RNB domain-containing ribonuclease [Betaproteobacteria bacterium]